MEHYQVIKVMMFSGVLCICIIVTNLEQRKDASEDTKVDFSFLESDTKHDDWIDPFNMFEYKPCSGNHKAKDKKAEQTDVKKEGDEKVSEQSADKLHQPTLHIGNVKNPTEMPEREGSESVLTNSASHQKSFGECSRTEEKPCKDEEFIYLKRTANMILNKLETLKRDSPSTVLRVILIVTEDAIATLKSFLGSPCKHVQEFDSTIATTLNNAELTESYTYFDSVYKHVHQLFQSETIIYCIATAIAMVISSRQLLRMSIKQIISHLIIITFILSFAWNWMLLVKMETANAYAKTEAAGPSDCHIDKMGTYKKITLILRSIFFPSSDKCKEYYEAVLIEPAWKVSPVLALSKTFSDLFFHPLGFLGQHLGNFFQNLFSAVSWYLLLPVSAIVTIIILVLLLLLFGYRIRLPFFAMEPGHHPSTREQNQLISDVLREQNQLISDVRQGRVHIQRTSSQMINVYESLEQCSNCSINSTMQKADEQKLKKTSLNEDKGIQTNISEPCSLCCCLTDTKTNGKIQEFETVTKRIDVMNNMHKEE